MGKWVMFDVETLGVRPTSLIVSLGACRFDADTPAEDKMALLLDMEEQHKWGRTIDVGTLTWWMRQSQEARDWNFNTYNRYPVDVALRAFNTFCEGAELFWCRGMNFDPILLESLYGDARLEVPWKFNRLRDVRTLDDLRMTGTAPGHSIVTVQHKPLDDCLVQVQQVREVFGDRLQAPAGMGFKVTTPELDAIKAQEGD